MDVTPKKLSNSEEFCVLCKDNFSPRISKIKVLGKSALDIPSLILKATKEDVNVYVERERFYICRMKCVSIGSYGIKMLFEKLKKSVLKYRKIISLMTRSASKDLLKNQKDCQRLQGA